MNVEVTLDFEKSLKSLDRSEQLLVKKTCERIANAEGLLGKPLHSNLKGLRSIRTGHNSRLRLILFQKSSTWILLNVGARENMAVYLEASELLNQLRD